jgi:hypothetical protein
MMKRIVPVVLAVLLAGAFAYGQEEFIELLRSDIKADKVAILTAVLELTPDEGTAFWPVYREYELEQDRINDRALAGLKDYAEHYDKMTGEKATELVQMVLTVDEDRVKLRQKYLKKFQKVLPPVKVARFYQAERQIALLLRLQVASEVPLIVEPETN